MDSPSCTPLDAATIAALKVARDVGNQCLTCGNPHTYRTVECHCDHVRCKGHTHPTWASPDDGHGYRPRARVDWMTALIEEAERG